MLWKESNKRTFDNVSATTSMVLLRIREVGDEWIAAGTGLWRECYCLRTSRSLFPVAKLVANLVQSSKLRR